MKTIYNRHKISIIFSSMVPNERMRINAVQQIRATPNDMAPLLLIFLAPVGYLIPSIPKDGSLSRKKHLIMRFIITYDT